MPILPQRRDTIHARLLMLTVATAAPLLLLFTVELLNDLRRARSDAAATSLHWARAIASQIEQERKEAEGLLQVVAARPAIIQQAVQCDPLFEGFTARRPEYANMALADETGRPVCSAIPVPAQATFAREPWFARARAAKGGFVTGPVRSPILGEWVILHVHPLTGRDGRFTGALLIPVRASRYTATLRQAARAPDTVSTLHDATGNIIARSIDHDRWVGKSGAQVAIVRNTLAGRTGAMRSHGLDGIDRIFGVVAIPGQAWWVQVGVPAAAVYGPVWRWTIRWLLATLAVTALSFLLAAIVARRIARPIRHLAERARSLSDGETAALGTISGPSEITQLGSSLEMLLQRRSEAEAALAARERRYQTILDTTSDGIWATGPDGLTTYVNPRMAAMLGRPPAEIVGRTASEMFPPETRPVLEEKLAARRRGIAETYELRAPIGGKIARWLVQSTPILDASGTYQGLVATIADVTREREAETRALEKEQQLESIFASAMDGIVIIDESQRVVMFNDAAASLFGVSREDAIGRRVEDFMPARFRPSHAEHVRRFGERHESRRAMGDLGSVFGIRTDGQEFPIEASISHVQSGGKTLYSVILRDVTSRLASERALRESENRLSAVVALSGAGVWEADTLADIFRGDERCADMLGYDEPASVPRTWTAITASIHSDDQVEFFRIVERLAVGEADVMDAEYRLRTAEGDVISVATVARVVERLGNDHMRILGATFDITARKEAAARLQEETQFNRTLIDASPAFFVAFGDDGTILTVNDAFLSATGYEREEVMGAEYVGMFIPPEAQAEARATRTSVTTGAETIAFEAPVMTRTGERLIVEWHARAIHSRTGELQFNFGVGLDITQRKRHETELRSHVGFLDALHETTLDLLRHRPFLETMETIVSRAAQLFGCPDAFLAMHDQQQDVLRIIAGAGGGRALIGEEMRVMETGLAFEAGDPLVVDDYQSWAGAQFKDRLPSRSMAFLPMWRNRAAIGVLAMGYRDVTQEFAPLQIEILTRFAQLAAVAVEHARLMADAEREIGERLRVEDEVRRLNANLEETVRRRTVELRQEIAERVRAEEDLRERSRQLSTANVELAAASKLKDEFLANMSHELRTPLNAILGMAEILEEGVHGQINDRQLRSVRLIAESGRHLLELINDILDLAKIESGKVDLAIEAVSVNAVCESSLRLLREAAQRKHIRLALDLATTVESLEADERRLRQILVNLLSNAVKFTPEGGSVALRVSTDESKSFVRFAVQDTGIGVPSSEIDRLFQPFVQLDSGSTRQYGGTGLGLSLVRRMAEMHHGTIEVESTVGEGSTFTLVLPLRVGGTVAPAAEPMHQGVGGNGPVLIIEDDRTAAQLVGRYLADVGLPVAVWNERDELVPLIEQMRPRLIVLDIFLASTTGWDVLTAIKTSASIAGTPVLIISIVDDAARGLAMGAIDYLVKPIRREHVNAALLRIFPELRRRIENRENGSLILLAEDNEANIEVVETYLASRGYHVLVARDGAAAVELALDRQPALILMDVQMPKLNGLDAIRRIREAEDGATPIPILALTAMATDADIVRCIAAGANECVTKPVSLKLLDETIRRYLERDDTEGGGNE